MTRNCTASLPRRCRGACPPLPRREQLAWDAALGLVLLYGVIAATVSLAVFRTRDIVS